MLSLFLFPTLRCKFLIFQYSAIIDQNIRSCEQIFHSIQLPWISTYRLKHILPCSKAIQDQALLKRTNLEEDLLYLLPDKFIETWVTLKVLQKTEKVWKFWHVEKAHKLFPKITDTRSSYSDNKPANLCAEFLALLRPSLPLPGQSVNQSGCGCHLPTTRLRIIQQGLQTTVI